MGAYTYIGSTVSFDSIRSAFGKSGAVSLYTYSSSYRLPRVYNPNISINSSYRNTSFWHITVTQPHNTTNSTNGFANGISSVSINIGGNALTYNSGTVWNSKDQTYVVSNSSYTTYSVSATVGYGYTFWFWENTANNTIISYTNSITITASSYVNIRPICYGGGSGA